MTTTKKKKEKLWLRCVNLGKNPSDADIENFLDSITGIDLNVEILGLDFKPMTDRENPMGWEIPNIDDFKDFHKEFMSIFHHRMETKRLHDSEEEWLNSYPMKCKINLVSFQDDPQEDEIAFGKRYEIGFRLDIHPIQNYIVHQFNLFLKSGRKLKRCEACNKYFVESPQGSEQKYCSKRCKNRMWARKNR